MMDVDTIIVNNITEIIEYAIKRNELMAGLRMRSTGTDASSHLHLWF